MDMKVAENPPSPAITQCARRSHRKSRAGCKICKARKVKCDEAKPRCTNCLKHSVQCEYPTPPPLIIYKGPASASAHDEHAGKDPTPTCSDSQLNLDLTDMELLHHYTTSTYYTLRSDPVQRTVWQVTVCEIGFSNEFVLRGILAIAALHLAYLRPSSKEFYTAKGAMHHQIGLRIATSLLPRINDENCTPLCVFSGLAGMYAMASPRAPEDFLLVNDKGLADWMVLMRGMSSIIDSSEPTLHAGPLGLMFQNGHRRFLHRSAEPFRLGSEHDDQVSLLQRRILESCADPRHAEAYILALTELRKSLNVLYACRDTYEASDAFMWVFFIPEAYIILLKKQDQSALCIFAYFCVILHQLAVHWWAHGWSVHLMNQIYRVLDEEHRWWIDWPIEQLGGTAILKNLSS